jgi:hypothetical protein
VFSLKNLVLTSLHFSNINHYLRVSVPNSQKLSKFIQNETHQKQHTPLFGAGQKANETDRGGSNSAGKLQPNG